jgi:hypothetical protein
MALSDRIVAVLALACLVFGFATLGWFVPDIDLVIVLVFATGLAVYDFFFYRPKKS